MRKWLIIFALVLTTLCMKPHDVDAVSLSVTKKTLFVKKSFVLTVKKATSATATSTNKSVATVSKYKKTKNKFTVKAVKPGTAKIKVKVKKKYYYCTITVKWPEYSITPSTNKTYSGKKKTGASRQRDVIDSYLSHFSSVGGGKLILQKGTYTLPSSSGTLFLDSNITIELQNATIKNSGGGAVFLFCKKSVYKQFVNTGYGNASGKYTGYNGLHDVHIIGKGTSVVDFNYRKNKCCVVMGHSKDVTISNIHFKNMHGGHLIEMDGCRDITIKDCKFSGFKHQDDSGASTKEAINLDNTYEGGFNQEWSALDNTPNKEIVIDNCSFYDLGRAIGTHNFNPTGSEDSTAHDHVTIKNCSFKNIGDTAQDDYIYGHSGKDTNCCASILMVNWTNAKILNNTFTPLASGKGMNAFEVKGVRGLTVSGNTLNGDMQLCNYLPHKEYSLIPAVYKGTGKNCRNILSEDDMRTMIHDNNNIDSIVIIYNDQDGKDWFLYHDHYNKDYDEEWKYIDGSWTLVEED